MQYFFRFIVFTLIFSLATASPIQAEPPRDSGGLTVYRYPFSDNLPRAVLLPPVLSFILPGLDQWIEGQYAYALPYTLVGTGGFLLHQASTASIDSRYRNFGLQIYFSAGAMSLFHSFRSAANTRKAGGDFKYLKRDESPSDLYASATKLNYLGRWTTLLPLISSFAMFFLLDTQSGNQLPVEFGDLFYASSTSFMTGVSEEVFFRGYLMPMLYHYTGSDTTSILIQGGAFGLAHGLRFKHYISATLFGLYAGWIVQKQDWELGEMIFVHTWIDLLAFLADYANHREPSSFSIPLVMMTF